MREFFSFVILFSVGALKTGCDPRDLFLHEKIPSTEKKTWLKPIIKDGVELDRRGASAKWTRPCCLRRDPNNDAICLEKKKDTPKTRRIYCRFLTLSLQSVSIVTLMTFSRFFEFSA